MGQGEIELLRMENEKLKKEIENIKKPENNKGLLDNKTILITGGTGSFGNSFVRHVLTNYNPAKIIVFSRDEMKQWTMNNQFRGNKKLEFVIGDVRDKRKLDLACLGVNYIIHTAAMKIVPTAEEHPAEVIKTNVLGAMNVIDAAVTNNVEKVIALSTDKACNPVNLYGATKLCSDKLFVAANSKSGKTAFSVVRYGNVIGSRGSIIPLFLEKKKEGIIPLTDERMTRFWITLEQGVRFVINSLNIMRGGEIFVPKIPSMKLVDLAKTIAPECEIKIIGIKPGEKLHESMISPDDARNAIEFKDFYIIQPQFDWWRCDYDGYRYVEEGFSYTSDKNTDFLSPEQMRVLIDEHMKLLEKVQYDYKSGENSTDNKKL